MWLLGVLDARERELDEDEREARRAAAMDCGASWSIRNDDEIEGVAEATGPAQAEHIARWDPARVLAEVKTGRADIDAKRRVVREYQRLARLERGKPSDLYFAGWVVAEKIVKMLAQSYAGRPGWREEWRS